MIVRSVLLVARSNLRRRRGQTLLIGSIIGLSVLLFFTGVGILREIERPLTLMFERQRGAHFTMVFDARIHAPDSVLSWWRAQPGVSLVGEATPTVALMERSYARSAALSTFLFVTERPLHPEGGPDSLRILEGAPHALPAPGEVWIPTSLAYDAHLTAGDTLEIPAADGLVPLVVGAVVVDPVFSAPFNNPIRVWVAPGSLPSYFKASSLNRVIASVRLATPARGDALWAAFVKHLGGAFNGNVYDYAGVRNGYTAPYVLMAAMIVAFSALGFLVALFAIQGTVTSAMLADFRMIGILRTQGFTPRDVRRVYELQYLLLAAVALPIGIGIGFFAVSGTINLLTRTIATPVPAGSLVGLGALTFVLFLALVYVFVVQVARAAGRVRPADAIRFGAQSTGTARVGISLSRLRRFPVPLLLGIRNLGLQRKRAIFLGVAIVFAALAAFLAVNLDHSFEAMRGNLASFGFDAASVRVSRVGRRFQIRHEALMTALRERPGVKAVATWDGIDGNVEVTPGGPNRVLFGTAVDGDIDGVGFENIRGRNPKGPGEISLAVRTAQSLKQDVGGRVTLNVMGAPLEFQVVGVYQSIDNTGEGFRIRLEAVRIANPLWMPVEYGLVLADGVAPAPFIAGLEAEYGEAVDAKAGDYFVHDQLEAVTSGLRMANGFLAVVFLLAAAVFIVNTTLLTIAENRRIFGILKTAGMTPAQLRMSVVSGVGVQAVLGLVAALVVWAVAARALLSVLFSGVGMVAFPLQNSLIGMAVVVPVILLFCLASAWVPSAAVLDVNPKALIVE